MLLGSHVQGSPVEEVEVLNCGSIAAKTRAWGQVFFAAKLTK
jgi:hypothetical protein